MKIKLLINAHSTYRKKGRIPSRPLTVLEIEEVLSKYIDPIKITLLPEKTYSTKVFNIEGETNNSLRKMLMSIEDDCKAKGYFITSIEYTEIETTVQDTNPSKRRSKIG